MSGKKEGTEEYRDMNDEVWGRHGDCSEKEEMIEQRIKFKSRDTYYVIFKTIVCMG